MTDQECLQAYQALAEVLRQRGLEWINLQVTEQIGLGKTIQREIETFKSGREVDVFAVSDDSPRLEKGPRAKFPVTIPYEPSERLTLLVDAIEEAVVKTADVEHHVLDFFGRERHVPAEVSFYADDPDGQVRTFSLSAAISRQQSSRNLKELLDSLRREI